MSTLIRYYLMMLLVIVGGLLIGYALVLTQSDALLIVLVLWVLAGSITLTRIKCTECGASIVRTGKLAGLPYASAFTRGHCRNCGADLLRQRQ
jgi:hypothetical protein